jgi:hypothetical protein
VVRDEQGGVPKWDELLKCKCDIDATLQELLDHRLVWNEARFCFVQDRDKNLGGNSLFRTANRIATECRRQLSIDEEAHGLPRYEHGMIRFSGGIFQTRPDILCLEIGVALQDLGLLDPCGK